MTVDATTVPAALPAVEPRRAIQVGRGVSGIFRRVGGISTGMKGDQRCRARSGDGTGRHPICGAIHGGVMPSSLTAVLPTNQVPPLNADTRETGCCPRFDPGPWDRLHLHFDHKLFVRATTRSVFHMPVNMSSVFRDTFAAIQSAQALSGPAPVFSHDESAWHAEHLFAVDRPVPGAEMVELSGDFVTKVFEGPFAEARRWCEEMARDVEAEGQTLETTYFFYTTCPKCAKYYGKNYVVGVAKIRRTA
jgi:hypothetical protein